MILQVDTVEFQETLFHAYCHVSLWSELSEQTYQHPASKDERKAHTPWKLNWDTSERKIDRFITPGVRV